ncbi:hypothetical protein JCM10213v2_006219 [Rhodosporidiobolus nylandii]
MYRTMGHLSPQDREKFEMQAGEALMAGRYEELMKQLEERVKRYKLKGVGSKVAHTEERLHWLKTGEWRSVIILSSDDEDEPMPQAGPSTPPNARNSSSSSSRESPNFVDLTLAPSDIEYLELSSGNEDANMLNSGPREPSPELFGAGHGPDGSSTPPTSPSVASEPRRTKRSAKPSVFYGNVVDWRAERPPQNAKNAPSPKKQKGKEKAVPVQLKVKQEKKPAEPEAPVPLPPRTFLATTQLFPGMASTSTPDEEVKRILVEDEKPYVRLQKAKRRWDKAPLKECTPYDDVTARARSGCRDETVFDVCRSATVGGEVVRSGDFVAVVGAHDEPWVGRVGYFLRKVKSKLEEDPELKVHLVWCSFARAIFGDGAHARHLLLRDECDSVPATTILRKVDVAVCGNDTTTSGLFLSCLWNRDEKSTSPLPNLSQLPAPLCQGRKIAPCWSCEDTLAFEGLNKVESDGAQPLPRWHSSTSSVDTFVYDDVEYHIGDDVFLQSSSIAQQTGHWSGAQAAFRLGRLLGLAAWDSTDPEERPRLKPSTLLRIAPYVRPGHLFNCGEGDWHERDLIVTNETVEIQLKNLVGKFSLRHGRAPESLPPHEDQDVFFADSYLPESLTPEENRTIESLWTYPPRLLKVHKKLRMDLKPIPLDAALPTCPVCAKVEQENEKKDAQFKAATADGVAKPTILSLFSGCGLLDLGLQLGCPELAILAAVENNAAAAQSFRDNHPDVEVFEMKVADLLEKVRQAGADDPLKNLGDADIVVGGPPCQSFSYANRKKDHRDSRSVQPFAFMGAFESGRPLFGILENVVGLLNARSADGSSAFGALCCLCIRLGYDIRPSVSNAAAHGCPQHRRRLLLHIAKRGLPVPAAPEPTHAVSAKHTRLSTRYGDEGDKPTRYTAVTKRATLHSAPLPAITVGRSLEEKFADVPPFDASVRPVSAPLGTSLQGESNNVAMGLGDKDYRRICAVGIPGETGEGNWEDFEHDPEYHTDKDLQIRPTAKKHAEDFYRRIWKDEISAPLLTRLQANGGNGARIHPTSDRLISLAEALAFQGAPLDYKLFPNLQEGEYLTKQHIETAYKHIGNGVAVPKAAAHAREFRKVIKNLVLDWPIPSSSSSTFFADLSRALSSGGGGAISAPVKKEPVEVIVLDDYSDDETEPERDSLDDGEAEADLVSGPFAEGAETDGEEVVVVSPKKTKKRAVDADSD